MSMCVCMYKLNESLFYFSRNIWFKLPLESTYFLFHDVLRSNVTHSIWCEKKIYIKRGYPYHSKAEHQFSRFLLFCSTFYRIFRIFFLNKYLNNHFYQRMFMKLETVKKAKKAATKKICYFPNTCIHSSMTKHFRLVSIDGFSGKMSQA